MSRVRTREWAAIDYYAVLDVAPEAGAAVIDARYRALAKTLHPDRTPDPISIERFKRVNAAYSVLRDASTRSAYDEFRNRLATGRLAAAPSRAPAPGVPRRVDHLAPPRVPKSRAPMPAWLRQSIAGVLVLAGLAAIAWAALGDINAPTAADTPVAVQITLVIVAIKFLVCGVLVAWYPQLRARWHH